MHKNLSLMQNFECIIYRKIGLLIINRLYSLTWKTFIIAKCGISNCNIFKKCLCTKKCIELPILLPTEMSKMPIS